MITEIRVFPRMDLDSDQYKKLGKSIDRLIYAPEDRGSRSVESAGLDDLLRGEPPQPYYLQRLVSIEARSVDEETRKEHLPHISDMTSDEREQLKRSLGKDAESRHVQLTISRGRDRKGIVSLLRRFLDTDLVQDVLINGVTWNESFDFDLRLYKSVCSTCQIVPKKECSREQLFHLGDVIRDWWGKEPRSPDSWWILQPGVADLLKGALPATVEEQFQEAESDGEVESPSYTESERRAVMFMVKKSMMPPSYIISMLKKTLPPECIDSVIIDDTSYDLSVERE